MEKMNRTEEGKKRGFRRKEGEYRRGEEIKLDEEREKKRRREEKRKKGGKEMMKKELKKRGEEMRKGYNRRKRKIEG